MGVPGLAGMMRSLTADRVEDESVSVSSDSLPEKNISALREDPHHDGETLSVLWFDLLRLLPGDERL